MKNHKHRRRLRWRRRAVFMMVILAAGAMYLALTETVAYQDYIPRENEWPPWAEPFIAIAAVGIVFIPYYALVMILGRMPGKHRSQAGKETGEGEGSEAELAAEEGAAPHV